MNPPRLFSSAAKTAARTAPRVCSSNSPARLACLGLFSRRERWGFSARGIFLVVAGGLSSALLVALAIYPFLAVTERVPADSLVVEGWVQDHGIRAATEEFTAGKYQLVFATGGPVHGIGAYHNDFSTAAAIGARKLTDAGLPLAQVHMVPSRTSERDRTYSSAVALCDWLRARHLTVHSLNVVTEDVHARRTRLLFQQAFGDLVSIGIISVPNPDYDARHWWRYSQGVREVISEGTAYLYARILFRAPASDASQTAAAAAP